MRCILNVLVMIVIVCSLECLCTTRLYARLGTKCFRQRIGGGGAMGGSWAVAQKKNTAREEVGMEKKRKNFTRKKVELVVP